ncbi:hypothetical protein N7453_011414 [Penicillium expansum]|nr:hypothetical protein N7453_011414 [Penicillium expansum]
MQVDFAGPWKLWSTNKLEGFTPEKGSASRCPRSIYKLSCNFMDLPRYPSVDSSTYCEQTSTTAILFAKTTTQATTTAEPSDVELVTEDSETG